MAESDHPSAIPGAPATASRRRKIVAALVLCLLLAFVAQAMSSMRVKSVTTDEIMYVAAGYYHLQTGRFDLNLTNPPLVKLLTAAPLLALGPDLPPTDDDPSRWGLTRQWQFARQFFYQNRVDADRMLFAARLPIVLLGLILGLYVFHWSRRLYGDAAGLFALLLYTFSPNILAHTRLATLDLTLTAFMFMFCYHLWSFIDRPRPLQLVLCGLFFGLAVLTKTTALFLGPIALLYLAFVMIKDDRAGVLESLPFVARIDGLRVRRRQLISLLVAGCVIGVVALAAINVGYGFTGTMQPLSSGSSHPELDPSAPAGESVSRGIVGLAMNLPVPVPRPFLEVVRFQSGQVSMGNNVYFAGQTSRQGWWYLMLVTLAIKTPLPMLVLLGWMLVSRAARPGRITGGEWMAISVLIVLIGLFSYLSSVNVGLRYILPVYPFIHLLGSGLLASARRRRVLGSVAIALLAVWYVWGTARIHPDYLAYFNESIGGPSNGHRYLADSNLDWGQDLKQLEAYLEQSGIERIRLAYFGSADAGYYGIDYDYLPSVGLKPRQPGEKWWYEVEEGELPPLRLDGPPIAVSATLLAGIFYPGHYAPLRELEPVDHVGYSILIYDPGGMIAEPRQEDAAGAAP